MIKQNTKISSIKTDIHNIHFIGICGIGMSGLAQAFRWLGYNISGSDRAINNSENKILIEKLRAQGIFVYPQDGSYISNNKPDKLVYSTAIESDNPDLQVAADIEKWHRAEALTFIQDSLRGTTSIAVSGSCGKTTVTAWIAETFFNIGLDPIVLNGGMINTFADELYTGNFRPGKGNYFVYEADESDKSLVAFYPDYSVLLNLGTDHYSKNELIEVFEEFLRKTRKGAVIEDNIMSLLDPNSYAHIKTIVFTSDIGKGLINHKNILSLGNYYSDNNRQYAVCRNSFSQSVTVELPIPGRHNADNLLAIMGLLDLLKISKSFDNITKAVSKFNGVHRRFERKGVTEKGALVIDDYAHNVEKIVSCIRTAQSICSGKVYAVFQPHGYGPFKFMKDLLFPELESCLSRNDKFILLPVYYAGGTSSFLPKSIDVNDEYNLKCKIKDMYLYLEAREIASNYLKTNADEKDIILIMGARDGSLALWADELVNRF
ncbi:MAG: hypothetical protein GY756_06280 [bacterium]|nr:hypothetical protein [bacterium]